MSASPTGSVAPAALSPMATARMALILRGGLLLSACVLVLGLLLAGEQGAGLGLTALHALANQAAFDPATIASELAQGRGTALVALGLLLLVATPVARVLLGMYSFQTEQDPTLARVALIVLALLLVGLFGLGPLLR